MTKSMFIRIQAEESEKDQILFDLRSLAINDAYEVFITFEQKKRLVA